MILTALAQVAAFFVGQIDQTFRCRLCNSIFSARHKVEVTHDEVEHSMNEHLSEFPDLFVPFGGALRIKVDSVDMQTALGTI